MLAVEDFFKTVEEKEDTNKERVLLRFVEKIVKKYFSDCICTRELSSILYDKNIMNEDKQYAVREKAEGLLQCIYFSNKKTDVFSLIKKGKNHEVVKELIEAINEHSCDILIFPLYKAGNWVIHSRGMSDTADKTPRILIPGNGIILTIQNVDSFVREYK